ncbi:hypothetical protein [Roseovarius sp. M141]|nr:hypothetical protein [Roseovarius sp. M141]
MTAPETLRRTRAIGPILRQMHAPAHHCDIARRGRILAGDALPD